MRTSAGYRFEQLEGVNDAQIDCCNGLVDGKSAGPEGDADWVEGWSEDDGLTERIEACLLGGRMYRDYEQYWTAIHGAPDQALPMTGQLPLPTELE